MIKLNLDKFVQSCNLKQCIQVTRYIIMVNVFSNPIIIIDFKITETFKNGQVGTAPIKDYYIG